MLTHFNPILHRTFNGCREISSLGQVTGLTQNAGSEKKDPSSGSWEYLDIMKELKKQSSKRTVEIEIAAQIYTIKNPYREHL